MGLRMFSMWACCCKSGSTEPGAPFLDEEGHAFLDEDGHEFEDE